MKTIYGIPSTLTTELDFLFPEMFRNVLDLFRNCPGNFRGMSRKSVEMPSVLLFFISYTS